MNFPFLATIVWFFTSSGKNDSILISPKDRFINGGVYIIQNENDGNILMANRSKVEGQHGDVITDRWKVTTKATWLLTENPYPRNDTYILRPTNNLINRVTNAEDNGVLRNDHYNFWKLQYGGRSFGAEKWLIILVGSTGDPNGSSGQSMCLENHKRGLPVIIDRPCNKVLHKQRWKFCAFQHPD